MSSKFRVYGGVIVAIMITLGFIAALYIVLSKTIPEGSDAIVNVLLGTLAALQTQVANYWLGSSAGSAAKDMQKQQ